MAVGRSSKHILHKKAKTFSQTLHSAVNRKVVSCSPANSSIISGSAVVQVSQLQFSQSASQSAVAWSVAAQQGTAQSFAAPSVAVQSVAAQSVKAHQDAVQSVAAQSVKELSSMA